MIQPGQKLSEGDYTTMLQYEQYLELIELENDPKYGTGDRIELAHECYFDGHILFDGYELVSEYDEGKIRQYAFPDFKALCENTFGDGKG